MARKFAELRAQMSPERRAANEAATKQMLLEMNLQELRTQMSDLSQGEVAKLLEVTQGYISRLERTKDISVRRLHEYIQTVGGELELRVKFLDKPDVIISQFESMNLREFVAGMVSQPPDVGDILPAPLAQAPEDTMLVKARRASPQTKSA